MAKQTKKHPRKQPADAVQILKTDHKQMRKLFEQYYEATDKDKGPLAGRLLAQLEIHSKLEEGLFYPTLQTKLESLELISRNDDLVINGNDSIESGADEDMDQLNGAELEALDEDVDEVTGSEILAEAYDSHQTIAELVQQLRSLDPTSNDFREVLTGLEDVVIEHVAEEEHMILPLAAAHLDVQALGIEMQRRKDDLTSRSSLAA